VAGTAGRSKAFVGTSQACSSVAVAGENRGIAVAVAVAGDPLVQCDAGAHR
jgi:hypothetical protein